NFLGVQQTDKPFARGETFEVGGGLRISWNSTGAVVAIITVTTGAFLREEFWSLSQGIVAEHRYGAAAGNAGRGFGENANAIGVVLGLFNCGEVVFVSPIFCLGEIRQQACASKEAEEKADVEEVT